MKKRILSIILSVCMLASAISINPMLANAAGETNVAKSKKGYASTEASGTLVNLTDGNTSAYNEYSSAGRLDDASQWVAVDLGASYVVNKVTLCTNSDQGLPSEFSILAYNGAKWVEVYHGTAPTDGSDKAKGNPFTFDAITCNAIKVIATRPSYRTSASKYVFRLAELQVYGVASDETLQAPTFGDHTTNVATIYNGTTITDASIFAWAENDSPMLEDGYTTYNSIRAIDNVFIWNTYHGYWFGDQGTDKQNTPMGMTLNFDKVYRINQITLEPAYSGQAYQGGFPEDFKIEALTKDGWKTVVTRTGFLPQEHNNQYRYKRNFYFPDTECTAVRLTTSKNGAIGDGNYGIRLGEFAAYGVEAPLWRENAAKNKQGYASTEASGTLVNLTDGNTSAYNEYSSAARLDDASQWVAVDLGQAYVIDEVKLCTNSDQGLPSEFSILAYNGEKWVEVYHGTAPTDGSDKATGNQFTFDAITCNAIKVIATRPSYRTSASKYVFRLAELQAYGVASKDTLEKPTFGDYTTNIATIYNGTTITDVSIFDWAEKDSPMLDDGYTTYSSMRAVDNVFVWNTYHGYWFGDQGTDKQTTPMGMTLNFDKAYRINHIVLEPAYSGQQYQGGFPEDFKIEALTKDGWQTVVTRTGFLPQEHTNQYRYKRNFYFPDTDCTAVRLTTSKNGAIGDGNYGIRLGEFAAYGVETEAWAQNIALPKYGTTVTASHVYQWYEDYGLKLERINDGNQSKGREFSFWASENVTQTTPVSVTMAFDKVYKVSSIRLDPAYTWDESAGGFPEEFIISAYTTDGWKTIVSETGITDVTDWQTYTFPEVDCTAVKLTTVKNSLTNEMTYALRLGEMEVYGLESNAEVGLYEYSAVQAQGTAFASTSRNTSGGIKLSALNDEVTSPLWDCYSSEFFSNPNGVQFAGITFDSAYWFNEITLQTYADWMPENFYISVYDGAKWVEVLRKTDYAGEGSTHTFTFDDICGSAVKVTAEKMRKISRENMKGYGISFAEMIIKGLPTTEVIKQPATDLFNISSGMEVSVGSIVDWTTELKNPNNLIDNNRSTLYFSNWSPSADNCEWVQITFDAPMVAHYIDVYPWAEADIAKRFPKDFEIQVYSGTNWKTVLAMNDFEITKEEYAGASEKGANLNAPFRFCFEPTECSSIRLVATELDTTSLANEGEAFGLQLLDMNVYGENATGTVAKPSNPKRGHQSPAAVVLSKGTNNEMLNDGDRTSPDNNYTSELVESADGTISMQFVFERPTTVDRIQFFPTDNGTFPTAFKVFAYTAEGWKLIKDAKDYTTYITGGFKLFSFKEVCCSSIIIQMTGLSELNGKYGVQLKDIDITGSISTDTGVVLADGSGDDKLTQVDLPYIQEELLQDEKSTKYDFNMDANIDSRDLVRAKVYFAKKK